jgi:RNA polymerase sigma-70 factor (ECF subfamily)
MRVSDADTASFLSVRRRLLGIAHQVLGSATDAEDVVQEAWIRWQRADRGEVRDTAAFLATTATRLSINVGQCARVRRETPAGPALPEPADAGADPAAGAERRDQVEAALAALLERLSPAERAAYVLREAFDYPHRRIAEVLGLSEANARQLVRRARLHLSDDLRARASAPGRRRLLDAFLAASRTGDLAALERVLAADAAGEVPAGLAA